MNCEFNEIEIIIKQLYLICISNVCLLTWCEAEDWATKPPP